MTKGRQLWRETRFFAVAFAGLFVLLYFATPPVNIRKTYFKQLEASPGEIVTLAAEGYWWRQCPATISGRWLDAQNLYVFKVDPSFEGGRALASFKYTVNEYKKVIPRKTTNGFPLPKRICYQTVSKHFCGIVQTSSKSPLACISIK